MDKTTGPANNSTEQSLFSILEKITENLKHQRLADVFRFVSFVPFETFGPHQHVRIEINYVKKGSCMIRLDNNETVRFNENEIMIISSQINHFFEAGHEGCTLMQLEFLPELFSRFSLYGKQMDEIFSEQNRLIKIVNNVRIMRAVQRIVNELNSKHRYYDYLVLMYYAELLILINRYMEEGYLPICDNISIKKAIAYIRLNFQSDITIKDVVSQTEVGERYLRKLFAQHLNLSPLQYLNQVRINKAIELLRNTEMSVKEICFHCGFKSPQYFSRMFKQQVGISPRELTR